MGRMLSETHAWDRMLSETHAWDRMLSETHAWDHTRLSVDESPATAMLSSGSASRGTPVARSISRRPATDSVSSSGTLCTRLARSWFWGGVRA
jgi:hypothetical protein